MKFRDIYNLIKNIEIERLSISTSSQKRNGITHEVMYIRKDQKIVLNKILEISYFKEKFSKQFEKFLSTEIEEFNREKAIIEDIYLIKNIIIFYKKIFEEIYPKLDEYSISIKIPEQYTFKGIGKYFEDLEKNIAPILYDERINGKFEIANFDTGSKWVDIILKTASALGLIISLTSEAAKVANMIQDFRLKELEIREKIEKLQLDKLKEENDKIKEYEKDISRLEIYMEIEKERNLEIRRKKAEKIYEQHYLIVSQKTDDNELIIKIDLALKTMAEHLIEGSQIRPAIEYKENFEGVDIQKLIKYNNSTKQIENKGL